MRTEYVDEFLALAGCLSFTKASRELFMSQSTLSRHVAALEEDLGAPLLRRDTHSVVLTDFGEQAVPVLVTIMDGYKDLQRSAQAAQSLAAGQLRLGLLYYSIGAIFDEFLPEFAQAYPHVDVTCMNYRPQEAYEALLAGEVDVAELPETRGYVRADVRMHSLCATRMVAIVAADNPLAARESIHMADLAGSRVWMFDADEISNTACRRTFAQLGFVPAEVATTHNIESVPQAIRAHGGVHVSGEHCARQGSAGIRYLPILDEQATSQLCLAYLTGNDNPLVPVFLHAVDSAMRGQGDECRAI